MHIPLIIAVLAILALVLLPVLDRPPSSESNAESNAKDLRAYLIRLARWAQE